ncbi:MAG TPA: hypothetical protein VGZ91_03240 [Candidatus Sulfotelmatobacter sp.]|jgi:hypothetical protein|nr:hypothetical protein [Candidatus Sulfotelmatobacter sp.]
MLRMIALLLVLSGTFLAVAPEAGSQAPAGKFFYDAIHATGDTALTVTGVQMCQGAEGVAGGTDPDTGLIGSQAIEKDMISHCSIK